MKSAEEYALEEWTNGDDGYPVHDIARIAFDAGLAEARSIWRKPEEKPPNGYRIVVVSTDHVTESLEWEDKYPWDITARNTVCWCYLSDFVQTLPDWATSEAGE